MWIPFSARSIEWVIERDLLLYKAALCWGYPEIWLIDLHVGWWDTKVRIGDRRLKRGNSNHPS